MITIQGVSLIINIREGVESMIPSIRGGVESMTPLSEGFGIYRLGIYDPLSEGVWIL